MHTSLTRSVFELTSPGDHVLHKRWRPQSTHTSMKSAHQGCSVLGSVNKCKLLHKQHHGSFLCHSACICMAYACIMCLGLAHQIMLCYNATGLQYIVQVKAAYAAGLQQDRCVPARFCP